MGKNIQYPPESDQHRGCGCRKQTITKNRRNLFMLFFFLGRLQQWTYPVGFWGSRFEELWHRPGGGDPSEYVCMDPRLSKQVVESDFENRHAFQRFVAKGFLFRVSYGIKMARKKKIAKLGFPKRFNVAPGWRTFSWLYYLASQRICSRGSFGLSGFTSHGAIMTAQTRPNVWINGRPIYIMQPWGNHGEKVSERIADITSKRLFLTFC